jgi:hypothetical protein
MTTTDGIDINELARELESQLDERRYYCWRGTIVHLTPEEFNVLRKHSS